MPSTKNRNLTKCREWERNRRNKFKDAISQLSELVNPQSKETEGTEDSKAAQLAKIEVILKAIAFIKNIVEEKSRLDATILALQVKVDNSKKNLNEASTQTISRNFQKLSGAGPKHKKLLMLKKHKHNLNKSKSKLIPVENNNQANKLVVNNTPTVIQNLPRLLPKTSQTDKKGNDKAIVVLPASPFVIPHRSLVMPPQPQTFFLIDTSFHAPARIPIVPRVLSEITKTTMVNNLPITAFSQPLSLAKNKKTKPIERSAILKPNNNIAGKKAIKPLVSKNNQTTVDKKPKVTAKKKETAKQKLNNGSREPKEKSKDKDNSSEIKEKSIVTKDQTVTSAVVNNSNKEKTASESTISKDLPKQPLVEQIDIVKDKQTISTVINKEPNVTLKVNDQTISTAHNKSISLVDKNTSTLNENTIAFGRKDFASNTATLDKNTSSYDKNSIAFDENTTLNKNLTSFDKNTVSFNKNPAPIDKNSTLNNKNTTSLDTSSFDKNTTNFDKSTTAFDKTTTSIDKNTSSFDKNTTSFDKNTTYSENACEKRFTQTEKQIIEEKEKNDKLSVIIDPSICENTVDGGNARLELAEEFLAASPTAAFLMTFPLVSGNRAESPAEEQHSFPPVPTRPLGSVIQNKKRSNVCIEPNNTDNYFTKSIGESEVKYSKANKSQSTSFTAQLQNIQFGKNPIRTDPKTTMSKDLPITLPNCSTENPFLNLTAPPLLSSFTTTESIFPLELENVFTKTTASQPSFNVNNNNFLFKNDSFCVNKNHIHNNSSIPSSHDFNSLSLYPCAVEQYSNKPTKAECGNDDNLMKIGTTRLTYDIDLGAHKTFDFSNTANNLHTYSKETAPVLTTVSALTASSYNPFNPDYHSSLINTPSSKRPGVKVNSFYNEPVSNIYSQPSNLWPEELSFYGNTVNTNAAHQQPSKLQSHNPFRYEQAMVNKQITPNNKMYDPKMLMVNYANNKPPPLGISHLLPERNSKKSNKMHINWMTSEVSSLNNNCHNMPNVELKDISKTSYNPEIMRKKQEHIEANVFPMSIPNYSSQGHQEEFQMWPSSRPLATAEITMELPPVNLPTLVGDLALGPHERKRPYDRTITAQPEQPSFSNFLSVSQLMDRSTDNSTSVRLPGIISNPQKFVISKNDSSIQFLHVGNQKPPVMNSNDTQPCYFFNDMRLPTLDTTQVATKQKNNRYSERTHPQKNSYSAEALIRGGNYTQKQPENSKPPYAHQKFHDLNSHQDSQMAQVSHFPTVLDYSENNYAPQPFSGTNLYNATTNTISTSFYSNFMPSTSSVMSTNYTGSNFSTDFIDYNSNADCNFGFPRIDNFKPRTSYTSTNNERPPTIYKPPRKEVTKHKLDCTKKESSKKYNKRPKMGAETDEWPDNSDMYLQGRWQRKSANLPFEDMGFPNFVGNQAVSQHPADVFSSHLMTPMTPVVPANAIRSVDTYPVTSRTNFNLSTIFPEIAKKVQ